MVRDFMMRIGGKKSSGMQEKTFFEGRSEKRREEKKEELENILDRFSSSRAVLVHRVGSTNRHCSVER